MNLLIDYLTPLAVIDHLLPTRYLAVSRELTTKFEEIHRGKATELIQYWQEAPLHGELVLLISGNTEEPLQDWSDLTPQDTLHICNPHTN